MKITVLTENLKRGLGVVIKGVNSRPQLPILSGVLMRVSDGELSLLSTDLEISFWVRIPAKIEGDGEVVLPAKLFFDLVSSLPAGSVEINLVEGNKIEISAKGIASEIVGQGAEDYPSIPRMSKKQTDILSKDFKEKVGRVLVSTSKDESRPVLTGVLWDISSEGLMTLVSTDGFRLSSDKIKVTGNIDEQKIVVPSRVLAEVMKIAGELGEEKVGVQIDKENQQIIFGLGDSEVTSKLIAGDFPPYQQIMPNTYSTQTFVERDDFLEAVKRASLFAKDGANIVKIELVGEKMVIRAESVQSGKSQTELMVEKEGNDVTVAFNAKYLVDCLAGGDEKVVWETEGELRPSVFKTASDESWTQVVMPVRTQS